MIKGFLALFTTGLIFKPMLLLGGVIGIVSYVTMSGEQLKILYTDWRLYVLFFIISGLYTFFFKKTYIENADRIDRIETSKTALSEFFVLSFSFVIGMLLASFFDFSMPEPSAQNMSSSSQNEELLQKYNTLLDQVK